MTMNSRKPQPAVGGGTGSGTSRGCVMSKNTKIEFQLPSTVVIPHRDSRFLNLWHEDFTPGQDVAVQQIRNEIAHHKVVAVMACPEDEEVRNQLLENFDLRVLMEIYEAFPDNPLPPGLLRRLYMAEPYLIADLLKPRATKKGTDEKVCDGQIAGQILLKVLELNGKDRNLGSLEQACKEVSDELAPLHINYVRPGDLKELFRKFRSVSHLWASLDMWMHASQHGEVRRLDNTKEIVPRNPDDFKLFLSGAEIRRERGENIKHGNAQRPILERDEMWKLPPELAYVCVPLK